MLLNLLKAKIHRATVTAADLHYEGSITVDRALMEAAGLLEHERVQVVDVDNGVRLETYVIPGEAGSGTICLNGAAARLVQPGDKVIIMAYTWVSAEEALGFRPRVVLVDQANKVKEIKLPGETPR
ncbi:aspartate 1-decarboxylase [Gelria sp. Kuro-4]|uniref:aspartate 1-decarboxylase n=1 Tax=Gelria sp. Kuro-4 TaxID=2796927 RepID=UPI001BED3D9A|nr:aspartate 1-decarboxylase [Gelria sp. Kuro-4]BCV24355.1 aspartate 1-decarboxylase [Gelria sp. Kuro-4]